MKFASLPPAVKQKVRAYRWDGIIEKHEGPFDYGEMGNRFDEPDFIFVNNFIVLLSVGHSHHKNIMVLRCIESADSNSLTIFLKDTTYVESQEQEIWDAGYLAVCDRFPGEEFYIAHVYHEWYIVDNSGLCATGADSN
ncbi:MAG: hypothetical protein KME35_23970 [Aphanocapsa sp. GSE-SYN-MK-11-07L]|jgi:hypothetical protein|nr:hypothetical protein [Aphanocapsa sp. GSE-SYN-MK-11-07L]